MTYKEKVAQKLSLAGAKEKVCVLGIESSCDETAAAVVVNGRTEVSSVVNSQIDIHKLYGGVVPEIASRNHIINIQTVVSEALSKAGLTINDIDIVGVTAGAGLLGSLLVGLSYAKALAFSRSLPLVAVNHIEGHICAGFIGTDLVPPFCALVISGGHTSVVHVRDYTEFEVIASTCDDACGEAFDKIARVLGLSYPGGPNLDKLSRSGQNNIVFSKVKGGGAYKISYSGLKTAVINYVRNREQRGESINAADVAASFTSAAFDGLIDFTFNTLKRLGLSSLLVCGGVAANSYLREQIKARAEQENILSVFPPMRLCGDNASMIASSAYYNFKARRNTAGLDLNAYSVLPIGKSIT